jgi:hypothetical protein
VLDRLNYLARGLHRAFRFRFIEGREWKDRKYAAPSPVFIKRQVLMRNSTPNATWIETGTFLGETTQFLSQSAQHVYSVEPEATLYERAKQRFADTENVSIIHATSEDTFPQLLPQLSGAVNFWLDGHFSAGFTFQGKVDTPIAEELAQIEVNRARFSRLSVLVDDVRCFDPSLPDYSSYPSVDFLVDWARRNKLKWHIEHDIFVATST